MDLKNTYNRIAADWNADHANDDWWQKGGAKFLTYLKPGSSILDVGCGPGHKTKVFVEKGFTVTAIDFSEEMIKLVKQQVPQATALVRDITKPLQLDQKFDAVYAQAVLLHIPKAQIHVVLKNILSPLKPEGYFYLTVKENRPGQTDEHIVHENDYGYEYERFFSFFTLPELKQFVKDAGLTKVYSDVTKNGDTNWIQIMAQKH